ncbi:acyl-CoA N-acyltransferase [Phycomyces nitens]|nr:acyl-CoA N-acyltransferase [Phycomyces nitens]
MQSLGSYYLIVIEDKGRIVACATLIIEYKLLHGCGKTGHIEDVVVHDSQRGKRLGQRLIEQINHMAKSLGCYKSILNCNQHNVPFYEKCNLNLANVQMAHYFENDS